MGRWQPFPLSRSGGTATYFIKNIFFPVSIRKQMVGHLALVPVVCGGEDLRRGGSRIGVKVRRWEKVGRGLREEKRISNTDPHAGTGH